MSDNLYTFWQSKTIYTIKCFKDEKLTIPYSLTGLSLVFIGKKRLTDADASAIFELEVGAGLEIDVVDDHIVYATLTSDNTATLTRTKTTTIYCELLVMIPERQTITQFEIPVRASLKEEVAS